MGYQPRPLLSVPHSLVSGGGFEYGTYSAPFRDVNPLDARILGGVLPRPLRNFRLKEWQHFALVNDDIYMSLALFDAKLLSLAQVCVYDRRRGAPLFYERKAFPGQMRLPETLWDSRASFYQRGFSMLIHNHLDAGMHHIEFDIRGKGKLPNLKGTFSCMESLEEIEPIVVCLPLGMGRGLYSHKCVTPAKGELSISGELIEFKEGEAYGLIDIHKGFYPYVMKWYWATAGGVRDDGTLIGFNLTNNQVRDQERYNENCLWLDGKLHLLPAVTFSNVSTEVSQCWDIRDAHDRVSLRFQPEVFRFVDIQALVLRSRYRGPYGTFSGWIRDRDGEKHEIERLFGMCEDFYLRI